MAEINKTQLNRNTRNTNNKSSKKRRKKKNSSVLGPLIGMLFGSGVVAIMLALVLIVEALSKGSKINGGSIPDSETKRYSADEEYISIDAQSFTAYIGQTYNLTVSANPQELSQSVVWTSSNEDAVIVDDNGMVRIVGEGVAAVTATADKYSSAIAIEGVKDASSSTDMGFPSLDIIKNDNASKDTQGDSQAAQSGEDATYQTEYDNSGSYDTNGSNTNGSNTNGNNTNGNDTNNSDNTNNGNGGNNGTVPGTPENTGTDGNPQNNNPKEDNTQESTTQYEVPTTETAPAINTDEMFAVLSGSGFTQYLPNAAIYEVNDDYYGEVIVESDSVHIYIKKRSVEFDMAVRSALAYLLPDTADSVWNTYCTFSSDKTISSGGRKVRFVMPATNAHSQIIVYNP